VCKNSPALRTGQSLLIEKDLVMMFGILGLGPEKLPLQSTVALS